MVEAAAGTPADSQIKTIDAAALFYAQHRHQLQIKKTGAPERKAKLRRLRNWIFDHRQEIRQALAADFRKPSAEVDLSEIFVVSSEIRHTMRHLRSWMRPQGVSESLALITASSQVLHEPRGTVLIISPWNYPFNLAVAPMVSAIAAGNCFIIKPSELSPHTSALLQEMVDTLFPPEEGLVIPGGVDTATRLLELPFDHIFFTGSPRVGKIVQTAAARHLASTTLELGGKSPAIVDETAAIADTAVKLIWGKFSNCGQTCIAPDYLLVQRDIYPTLLNALKATITDFYGATPAARQATPDYARIINNMHHSRLEDLLQDALDNGAELEFGGESDAASRYLSPTLLANPAVDSRIMQEEIFGPLLPVLLYDRLEEALEIVRQREKPLALYIFSKNRRNIKTILDGTSAGGGCINDVLIHFTQPNLPFGGINNSGLGNSHGHYGFKAFSHERAILRHHQFTPLKLLMPPYAPWKQRLMELISRYL